MTVPLRCVLDTNICIKQFIVDPLTPKVNQLFDCLDDPAVEFFVPDLFITLQSLKWIRFLYQAIVVEFPDQ